MTEPQKPEPPDIRRLSQENSNNIQSYRQAAADADEARKKRDEENKQVAEAKKKREEAFSKLGALKGKLAEKQEQIRKIGPVEKPRGTRGLEEELERKEWLLQTEGTSPSKEKALSKEIRKLGEELKKAKQADALWSETSEIRRQISELSTEARAIHQSLVMHARKSEALHNKMIGSRKRADDERKLISGNIDRIQDARRAADEREKQSDEYKARATQRRQAEEKAKVNSLRSEAEKILDEFKKGKKISSDDLKLIQAA
ncbi:MAG: hypothetical protein NTY90_03550 [Candidatus Micrarchaeota archaeon]|nr:hypothetical protein [Candidatus Micrarchaeota archaeon]